MIDIKKVADEADVIVNGYAFTHSDKNFKVLNLNRPEKAAVLTEAGEVLETSMDEIEVRIVCDYLSKNKRFVEG